MYLNAARLRARTRPPTATLRRFSIRIARFGIEPMIDARRCVARTVGDGRRGQPLPSRSRDRLACTRARPASMRRIGSAIVALYDALQRLAPSPVVALNRAVAIAAARRTAGRLAGDRRNRRFRRLNEYPFYHAARAELELRLGNDAVARGHFERAVALARNAAERKFSWSAHRGESRKLWRHRPLRERCRKAGSRRRRGYRR